MPVPRAFLVRSATFIAWTPHGVLGSVRLARGPNASRHSERFGGSQLDTHCLAPRIFASRDAELSGVDVLCPRRPLRSSLWHLCRLFPLPRNVRCPFGLPSVVNAFSFDLLFRACVTFPCGEAAKVAVTTASWKAMARDNPRCLPPTRTLRRIRWPLRPRSRDRPTTFWVMWRPLDDVLTPPWVSPGPPRFFNPRTRPSHQLSFRSTQSQGQRTLACRNPEAAPPRPPFTLTATLFGALRGSLFEARMLPADFCNCLRRTDERSRAPVSSQGRWPWPPSFSWTHHARPSLARSGDTRRAAHSSVWSWPRCRFFPVTQVCPTAISRPPRHLRYRRLAPPAGKFSADWRARVSGPSEGRVLERGGAY